MWLHATLAANSSLPAYQQPLQPGPRYNQVVIITQGRSGSSFIGELLSQVMSVSFALLSMTSACGVKHQSSEKASLKHNSTHKIVVVATPAQWAALMGLYLACGECVSCRRCQVPCIFTSLAALSTLHYGAATGSSGKSMSLNARSVFCKID